MSAAVAPITDATRTPQTSLISVTPEIAEAWLAEANIKNRNMRSRHVQRLARDMASGNWKMTGESIKFARSGALLDGQHRLAAVVESGATISTLVTTNLPNDAQAAMDSGSARTAADAVGLLGIKNPTTAAAAARLAISEVKAPEQIGKFHATHAEVIGFLDANPDMDDAVDYASFIRRRVDVPIAIVAYTLWRLARVDRDQAYDFWAGMAEGVGLAAGDPILALRNRFAQGRRSGEYISREGYVSAIFRAWNVRREGKALHKIRIISRHGGVIPVPVPR